MYGNSSQYFKGFLIATLRRFKVRLRCFLVRGVVKGLYPHSLTSTSSHTTYIANIGGLLPQLVTMADMKGLAVKSNGLSMIDIDCMYVQSNPLSLGRPSSVCEADYDRQ